MRHRDSAERSRAVAMWLFATAVLIVAVTVVGGATRLTGSGLSITEWRPVTGVIPPLSQQGWLAEFAKYQHTGQYRFVNLGMSLDQFKSIYRWEWVHRLLGRTIGLVFVVPLLFFAAVHRIPRRLAWRCWALLSLGALQGVVGWWMVASGLAHRVAVAPERLATHLGLAISIYGFAVWTGLEAWSGRGRPAAVSSRWPGWAAALLGLVFAQILLGALVAGNQAGRIDTDWPLMDGRLFPTDYGAAGLWSTLVHSRPAVQFNHRILAYLIFVVALGFAMAVVTSPGLSRTVKRLTGLLAVVVTGQGVLGIVTLKAAATLTLSLAHQIWAVVVLTAALAVVWRIRRA